MLYSYSWMKKVVDATYHGFGHEPNGGSYFQGTAVFDFEDGAVIEIEDMSCSELDTRILAVLKLPDGDKVGAYYGSMIEPEMQYSSFEKEHLEYIKGLLDENDYRIPLKEEILWDAICKKSRR